MLILRLSKREDQALILISTILKFSAQRSIFFFKIFKVNPEVYIFLEFLKLIQRFMYFFRIFKVNPEVYIFLEFLKLFQRFRIF